MIMVDICRPFLNVASLCIHAGELGVRRSSAHHVFVIYFRASSEILHAFLSATRIGNSYERKGIGTPPQNELSIMQIFSERLLVLSIDAVAPLFVASFTNSSLFWIHSLSSFSLHFQAN